MNIIHKIIAYLQLREAVRKADQEHEKTGGRYYVMPTFSSPKGPFGRPQLLIMDRKNFRLLRHKGYVPINATMRDLVTSSFYFTPYRDGRGYMTKYARETRLRMFYSWYDAERKTIKANRKRTRKMAKDARKRDK